MAATITEANLDDPAHASAIVEIIDSYAREPQGGGAPLSDDARANLIDGLRAHPTSLVLLAVVDGAPVGAAVCQWGFSTFAARPLVNIHDLAVLPEHRGQGIGQALLLAVEQRAMARGCCRVTLEVHDENVGAKRLYERYGFGPWEPPTWFVSKALA
jgi:ribosomal protein S18 acetylase RimI-like enzyme